MNKERKLLIWSIVFVIFYMLFDYFILSKIDLSQFMQNQNINVDLNSKYDVVNYVINIIGIIYFVFLIFNKKIDLNNHSKGILIYSIIFFMFSNIISGILGFVAYSDLDKKRNKQKRELPVIEYKEFTNKYICLVAFIICLVIMFVVSKYVSGLFGMILIYLSILILMVIVFRKQLIHDFKIFKEYFREYISLTAKTWLKSLVVMMILGIIIQLVTNTSQSNNQQTLQKIFNSYPILIALLSMLYAPFAEELMFRGVIRKFIKSRYLFIIISGVLFGLLHVIDDSKTLAEFSYVLVYSSLGMFLASLYYKTNNLFTNISFHFMQNTLGVIGMILLYFIK
ncbi:MAG: CPBP family intramembrane metalloprotease [Bacilli bacterium]|nr:CPBP family intramembrane metalloprotease [Bacilli bacterium]